MDLKAELEGLRASLSRADDIQTELDRRVFHLKTLYDVSKDIFACVESETIFRIFLMMTMGNFGVMEGFILTKEIASSDSDRFFCIGFQDEDAPHLRNSGKRLLMKASTEAQARNGEDLTALGLLPESVGCALSFAVDPSCRGLMGLGPKLTGEPYNDDDRELLTTLLNNLVVAIKNARSFEEIKLLNEDLQENNARLEEALRNLKAALRKVEILESMKANLSKFVPTTVCRLIEKSPTGDILDSKEQDVSVLFLDIEGYTKMCERLGGEKLNEIIEKYFSVVMDAIYANNGDVNETAGDGLMVLFLNEDEKVNAREAVGTALDIREKLACIGDECEAITGPLLINIGINSGRALVGAARFESYTGSRWTYTARGITTNIASRLGALATGGSVFLSRTTADRVAGRFTLTPMGRFKLKNVSEEIEVFSV
jgi:class 3 adenylate cyclase